MQTTTTQAQGWTVKNWGTWGWVETIVKVVAFIVGIIAFIGSLSSSGFTVGGHPHLAAVILLGLLTLIGLGLMGFRFSQREIVSTAFAIASFVGHGALLLALLREPTLVTLPILFGVIFIVGQLVKYLFLQTTGFTEPGQTPRSMLIANTVLTVPYILLIVFLLL